jgi:hypothetical protein
MLMLVTFIDVRNGVKFIEFLKSLGYSVSEEMHSVLPDSSEYAIYSCVKDGQLRAVFAMHYIDHHYAALVDIGENASDREVLEALLKARSEKGYWIVPVEHVLLVPLDYELLRAVESYSDEADERAVKYLEHYHSKASTWRDVLADLVPLLIRFSKEATPIMEKQ